MKEKKKWINYGWTQNITKRNEWVMVKPQKPQKRKMNRKKKEDRNVKKRKDRK